MRPQEDEMKKHHSHQMHPYANAQEPEDQTPREEYKMPGAATDGSANDPANPADPAGIAGQAGQDSPAGEQGKSPEEMARAEVEDMRLRMAAEMDNFKKRLTRDHQEQVRYAAEKVLSDLLPALDNLDLAIQYGSAHEACKDMMQGIEMTRKQLLDAVAKSGLVSLGEKGEAFDPAVHEAIGVEAAPDVEPGSVSRVLQRGYKLHDRLLRPAKVMVNN